MNILGQILGAALGGGQQQQAAGSPIMNIIMQMLMNRAGGGGQQGGIPGLGAMPGGQGQQGGGLEALLGSILGGGQGALGAMQGGPSKGGQMQGGQMQGGQADQAGGALASGLEGLLRQFAGAGLGDTAKTWVGRGENAPVTPDQVGSVFGEDELRGYAEKSGIGLPQLKESIAKELPRVVDQLTPDGQIAAPESYSKMFAGWGGMKG